MFKTYLSAKLRCVSIELDHVHTLNEAPTEHESWHKLDFLKIGLNP